MMRVSHGFLHRGPRALLDDVSIELTPGRITAVLGANGAGKSTLLRVMSGDDTLSRGTISVSGTPLNAVNPLTLAQLRAVLPQHSTLTFPFTAQAVVMLGMTPWQDLLDAEVLKKVAARVVHELDASSLMHRAYPTLSGGEQQRVQLARVLAQLEPAANPSGCALLLDEPVSALDLAHQDWVVAAARQRARRGMAVMMVLHDLNLAARHADDVVLLRDGTVLAQGPVTDVMQPHLLRQTFGVPIDATNTEVHGRVFFPSSRRLAGVVVAAALAGCAPLAVESTDAGPGEHTRRFHQDAPALGGGWYEYDSTTHVLTPKAESYVLRIQTPQGVRHTAFRPESYYDPETAESGRFTLQTSIHNGDWAAPRQLITSRSIRGGDPLCLDVLAREERDCASTNWHLQLRVQPKMVPEGPLVVAEPGFFVRSVPGMTEEQHTTLATVSGVTNLEQLPDPSTLQDLTDRAPAAWGALDWDRTHFAANTPEAGMTLGALMRRTGKSDAFVLLDGRRFLVRFQVDVAADGAQATVRWSRSSAVVTSELVEFGPLQEVVVALPAQPRGQLHLAFRAPTLLVTDLSHNPLHVPPNQGDWDLSVMRSDDGQLHTFLSSACAVANATADSEGAVTVVDAVTP